MLEVVDSMTQVDSMQDRKQDTRTPDPDDSYLQLSKQLIPDSF